MLVVTTIAEMRALTKQWQREGEAGRAGADHGGAACGASLAGAGGAGELRARGDEPLCEPDAVWAERRLCAVSADV